MGFLGKFLTFIFLEILLFLLQLFAKEIGSLSFNFQGHEFKIGIYLVGIAIISAIFVIFIIKSSLSFVLNLFSTNKTSRDQKEISNVVKLIVSNDFEFMKLFPKVELSENLKVLKIALALKRNLLPGKFSEKTGIREVDILLQKRTLQILLNSGEINKAIELSNNIINHYPKGVKVIQEELLKISQNAIQNNLKFYFDPKMFKYELSQDYISKYIISIELIKSEQESDSKKKTSILERLHKSYPENNSILIELLKTGNFNDKKTLELINDTISINPNRQISKYLIALNRNDIFEKTQSMLSQISNENIEKLWILLDIATQKEFLTKVKELISKLVIIDKSLDITKFYIKHQEFLSRDSEILNIIKKAVI